VPDHVPAIYQQFRADYPDVATAYDALSGSLHEAGPLDARSRRLIRLAIAIGAESAGAVRSHVRKALDDGLSLAEVEHTVLLAATTIGLPGTIAALGWVREVNEARQ
jgi:alkylhydroperoxidase/carboxymuconolactone decarboxylase family protein YurZ